MKLARIQIENFRHLGSREKPLELDFTDSLGRVREFSLFVGPNTCGKTTILDAIALALGRSVSMAALRSGFKISPRTIVCRGKLKAKVTCWLRFSPEEIAATRELFRLAEISQKVPDTQEVKLTWTYPAPKKPSRFATATFTGPLWQVIGPTTSLNSPLSCASIFEFAMTHFVMVITSPSAARPRSISRRRISCLRARPETAIPPARSRG